MDFSGHLLALLLLFLTATAETAATNGRHGVVSLEELIKLSETEYNRVMRLRGNAVRITVCRPLDPDFKLPTAGSFNLPIIFHVNNPALGSNSGMPWVFLATGTVEPPILRWSYRKVYLDALNPVSMDTMSALMHDDGLKGC